MSYIDVCAVSSVSKPSDEEEPILDLSPAPKSKKSKITLSEAKNGAINYSKIIAEKPKKEIVIEYFKQRIARDLDDSDEDEEDDDYIDEKPKKKGKKD